MFSGKPNLSSGTEILLIKSFSSISEKNGAFDLYVATSYRLQVDTTPIPHDSPAVFRLKSVTEPPEFQPEALVTTTDFSEQENGNSGFESKQETVAVTVFTKAERGKWETLLKSDLNFCTVSVDCWYVFTLHLPYLPVQSVSESCSNLWTKGSLDINSVEDFVLEEINSEVELKQFMTTACLLEVEEIFSEFELKLGSARLSAFSNKPGELQIEAELELCTILTNVAE